MQSATAKVNRYVYRTIDRGDADIHRLRHRCLFDVEYVQPLYQLLQVVAERQMVLVGAGETICSYGAGEY